MWWKEFEGYKTVEFEVLGFINNSHATGADLLNDFVM
jgi:hypothetical protein